ncbi:hypothetical protein [Microcystis phage Mvi-JY20]|uniref:Uncharacterized protein n=1 Tax=Microcystis phage Mvi-JY20 TaxID=3128146 RepID=A0AAX4QI65_9CAUD
MFDTIINKFFRKTPDRALPELDISELPTPLALAEATYFARTGQPDLYTLASALLHLLAKKISDRADAGHNHLLFYMTYGDLARAAHKTTGKSLKFYTNKERQEALSIVGEAIVSALKRKGYSVSGELSTNYGRVMVGIHTEYRIRVYW